MFSGSRAAEEPKAYGPVFQDPDEFVESLLQSEQVDEIKEEQTPNAQGDELVDLVSESASDSDTSSFNSDFEDSDVDEPESGDYDCLKAPPKRARMMIEYTKEDAFVKNNWSKINHCVPGIGDQVSQSVYANGNLMQRTSLPVVAVRHRIIQWFMRLPIGPQNVEYVSRASVGWHSKSKASHA